MPGNNPEPNEVVAEILAFGFNITADRQNSIQEFSADSASTIVTHFHKRQFGTKLAVKWNPKSFPT